MTLAHFSSYVRVLGVYQVFSSSSHNCAWWTKALFRVERTHVPCQHAGCVAESNRETSQIEPGRFGKSTKQIGLLVSLVSKYLLRFGMTGPEHGTHPNRPRPNRTHLLSYDWSPKVTLA